jgi:hypothetical protein
MTFEGPNFLKYDFLKFAQGVPVFFSPRWYDYAHCDGFDCQQSTLAFNSLPQLPLQRSVQTLFSARRLHLFFRNDLHLPEKKKFSAASDTSVFWLLLFCCRHNDAVTNVHVNIFANTDISWDQLCCNAYTMSNIATWEMLRDDL